MDHEIQKFKVVGGRVVKAALLMWVLNSSRWVEIIRALDD